MHNRVIKVAAAAAACGLVLAACGSTKDNAAAPGSGGNTAGGKVGATLPLLTSPFWQAYNNYVPQMAKTEGVDVLPTVNADSDPAKLITDIGTFLNQGVKGLLVTPLGPNFDDAKLSLTARMSGTAQPSHFVLSICNATDGDFTPADEGIAFSYIVFDIP